MKCLRVEKAAEFLDCKPVTVYAYIAKGMLPAVRIRAIDAKGEARKKHLVRVLESDLMDFVQKHRS